MFRFSCLAAIGACLLACGTASAGGSDAASCAGGYAPSFRLGGAVESPRTFDAAALAALPSARQAVDYYSGSAGLVSQTYVGIPLAELLDDAVVRVDPTVKNDILRKVVVVTGSDCYEVVLSLGELRPDFGGSAQALVAYATGDGSALSASEGAMRLVVPGDKKGGRYVSNIVRISVRSVDH